jgi:hypothetical protein
MIIDACKPLSWINEFPTASALSLEEAAAIEAKWKHALSG